MREIADASKEVGLHVSNGWPPCSASHMSITIANVTLILTKLWVPASKCFINVPSHQSDEKLRKAKAQCGYTALKNVKDMKNYDAFVRLQRLNKLTAST
jgi:hypothetical protein